MDITVFDNMKLAIKNLLLYEILYFIRMNKIVNFFISIHERFYILNYIVFILV